MLIAFWQKKPQIHETSAEGSSPWHIVGLLQISCRDVEPCTDSDDKQSSKGSKPLYQVTHGKSGKRLSSIANAYDPPRTTSSGVYNYIADHIEGWIEEAITIRNNN